MTDERLFERLARHATASLLARGRDAFRHAYQQVHR